MMKEKAGQLILKIHVTCFVNHFDRYTYIMINY